LLLALALFAGCASETAQITMTVQPDESGVMKFYASAQQLVVNWGDGQTEIFTNVIDSGISHTYAAHKTYTVRISETQLTKLGDRFPCAIEDVLENCYIAAYMAGDIKQLYIDGCASLKGVIVTGYPYVKNRGALTDLEIKNCPALQVLYCYNNQLTSLDVSSCTALKYLHCYNNQLTSLDVSSCTALQYLHCYNNQLASLDVSGCTALHYLFCYNNQLTSLDVSSLTALNHLDC
jgi:Leucine-rich repeat (LRR) protein